MKLECFSFRLRKVNFYEWFHDFLQQTKFFSARIFCNWAQEKMRYPMFFFNNFESLTFLPAQIWTYIIRGWKLVDISTHSSILLKFLLYGEGHRTVYCGTPSWNGNTPGWRLRNIQRWSALIQNTFRSVSALFRDFHVMNSADSALNSTKNGNFQS